MGPGLLVHLLMGYRGCCCRSRRRDSPRSKIPCLNGRHCVLGFGATSRSRPCRSRMLPTSQNLASGRARPSSCHRESERCCCCRPSPTRNRKVRPQCWHCRDGNLSAHYVAARWPRRRGFPGGRCMRPPPGSAQVSACESPLRQPFGPRSQWLQQRHPLSQLKRPLLRWCRPQCQLRRLPLPLLLHQPRYPTQAPAPRWCLGLRLGRGQSLSQRVRLQPFRLQAVREQTCRHLLLRQ